MKDSLRLATIFFSVALHGLLACVLIFFPQKDTAAAEAVYSISMADFSTAESLACAPAPSPQAASAPEQQPDPHPPAPVTETTPALTPTPEEPCTPPEKVISTKKIKTAEKKLPEPKKAISRPQVPSPQPSANTSTQAQTPPSAISGGGGGADSGLQNVGGFSAYNTNRVDQIPSISRKVMPDYPSKAKRLEMQGRVVVRLVVDAAGEPQACAVHAANPPGYFEDAALDAAKRTRFIPGKLRGQIVNTVVLLPFTFSLR